MKGEALNVNINLVVVVFLGLICLVCAGGTIYLEAIDRPPSVALVSTLAGCVGAITGILVPARSPDSKAQS